MEQSQRPDFYVEEEMCICCRTSESAAPDLIGFHDDPNPGKSHCFFKKQPETTAEVERAVRAVNACCCGAYRYRGADSQVKRQLDPDSVG